MAGRRRAIIALTAVAAASFGATPANADGPAAPLQVSLQNQVVGNTAFSYLEVASATDTGVSYRAVPSRHIPGCRYWSDWRLVRVNAVSHERTYGVYIYDGCNHDAQVFPVPTDIRQGSCNNDDNLFPTGKFSVCPIIAEGHVPAGLPFDRHCEALTEADTSLFVDVTPQTFDSTQPTTLTLTTHFDSDMTQRLSEGTCTDVLDWSAIAWTVHWPDGTTDHLGSTGHDGLTQVHRIPPSKSGGAEEAQVTVIARLHVIGQALDFDANGNPYVRNVDGYVDISNRDAATGTGAAPVDEPPLLQLGAIPTGQDGDGNLPPPDASATPVARAVTIRGRLLALWLSPIVIRPGLELIDGVQIGVATSRVLRWHYLGGPTDAPPSEGTTPNAHGDAETPVVVQYNHPERLDNAGNPMDETVHLVVVVRSTYPDGTVTDTTLDSSIAVAIYYAGLTGPT